MPMMLRFEDSTLNYVLVGTTATIICLAIFTLIVVIYKVYTSVIHGNQSLGCIALVSELFFFVELRATVFLAWRCDAQSRRLSLHSRHRQRGLASFSSCLL